MGEAHIQQPEAEPLAQVKQLHANARSLDEIVADEDHRGRRRRWVWLAGLLVLIGAGVTLWWFGRPQPAAMHERFELQTLSSGEVAREVVATGRLEARGAVEVGAEISGRVVSVEVDHEDRVEVGQALVRFDTESLDAQVAQAKAAVASAKAALAQAKVSLLEAERRELQAQTLHKQGFESHENFQAAKSATELAEAQVDAAAAALSAQRASYELTKTQASKAVIESPIAGVVISRYVDPGQTLAASFQTPTLFVIAEDLGRMKVVTPIDEADIGELTLGQRATFTVDAYPDMVFEAELVELRQEARIVQSVVTYDAVLYVENPEHKLRPGMTASVRIETARADDVLRVPTAALRFRPPGEALPAETGVGVWVIEADELRHIELELGVANARYAELVSGALEPGAELITELSEIGRATYGAQRSEATQPSGGKPHP